jgi:hypothetical protein
MTEISRKNLWVLKYDYYLFFMLLPSSQFSEPPLNWKCSAAYALNFNTSPLDRISQKIAGKFL